MCQTDYDSHSIQNESKPSNKMIRSHNHDCNHKNRYPIRIVVNIRIFYMRKVMFYLRNMYVCAKHWDPWHAQSYVLMTKYVRLRNIYDLWIAQSHVSHTEYIYIYIYIYLLDIRIFDMRKVMSYWRNMYVCETLGSVICAKSCLT